MNALLGRRIIGMTFDGRPIFDPYPANSHLVFGASGSAKTTSVLMTALMSSISDATCALIVNDVKEGEVSAQSVEMCRKYGRKVGVLDDFRVHGEDYPHRYSLNPFGGIVETYLRDPRELPFAIDTACHALIEEPSEGDSKNKWFRDCPREELGLGIRLLLERNIRLTTPGALYSLIGDPELWEKARIIGAEEGGPATQSQAKQSLDLQKHNPEQYYQHMRAALSAIKIYEPGSALHEAGRDADLTHLQILKEGWIFYLVQPQRHAGRVGAHYALHMQSFNDALMASTETSTRFLLDEVTNAPMSSSISRVTIVRSYNGRYLYIAQSRLDLERKYGVKETAILEENCPVVQYLSFTRAEEAERVAKAIGEQMTVSHTLSVSSDRTDLSGTFSTGKELSFTVDELMNLPRDEQILRIQNLGFVHCKKFYQNQAGPYCRDLAPNPLEGNRVLPPDPKVSFDPTLRNRKGEPL